MALPEKSKSDEDESLIASDQQLFEDVGKILHGMSPEDLKKFKSFNHRFKPLIENLEKERQCECLSALKTITGLHRKKITNIFDRALSTAKSLIHREKKKQCESMKACAPHLFSVNLSTDPLIVEDTDPILIEMTKRCPSIEHINIEGCNVTAEGIRALRTMRSLTSLSFSFCETMDEDLFLALCSLTQLKCLKLCCCTKIPLPFFSHFEQLTHLEQLNLSHSNITDEELKVIGKLESLTILNCEDCSGISDEGLPHLKTLHHLVALNVSSCSITGHALKFIAETFPKITTLELRGLRIDDDDVCQISRLDCLTSLDLSWSANLDGSFLDKFSNKGRLQILTLSHCRNLRELTCRWDRYTSLQILNMSYCNLDDQFLAEVSLAPLLMGASFSYSTGISLHGVQHLAHMPHLKFLDLVFCDLDEHAVRPLFAEEIELRI